MCLEHSWAEVFWSNFLFHAGTVNLHLFCNILHELAEYLKMIGCFAAAGVLG